MGALTDETGTDESPRWIPPERCTVMPGQPYRGTLSGKHSGENLHANICHKRSCDMFERKRIPDFDHISYQIEEVLVVQTFSSSYKLTLTFLLDIQTTNMLTVAARGPAENARRITKDGVRVLGIQPRSPTLVLCSFYLIFISHQV